LLELTRTFIESSDINPEMAAIPQTDLLIQLLQRKTVFPDSKVSSAISSIEKNCVSANVNLKREILNQKSKIKRLAEEIEGLTCEAAKNAEERMLIEKELEEKRSSNLYRIGISEDMFHGGSADIASYLDQLIDCLLALDEKTMALEQRDLLLHNYKEKFLPLAITCRLLYKEFESTKSKYNSDCKTLSESLLTATEHNKVLQAKTSRLEDTIESLNGSPDDVERALINSQRKLVVFEVNSATLKRQIAATSTNLKAVTKENISLTRDIENLNQVARQTICRLYSQHSELRNRVEYLSDMQDESISMTDYRSLENKLNLFVVKNKIMMERERDRIDLQVNSSSNERQVDLLINTNNKLELKVIELEKKVLVNITSGICF
jgi:chromosome segregation ATPase